MFSGSAGGVPAAFLDADMSQYCTFFQNFSGEDASCRYPPPLVVCVRGWPRLDERQIYQELQPLCRFDIRRLSENQFILLSNRFKQ